MESNLSKIRNSVVSGTQVTKIYVSHIYHHFNDEQDPFSQNQVLENIFRVLITTSEGDIKQIIVHTKNKLRAYLQGEKVKIDKITSLDNVILLEAKFLFRTLDHINNTIWVTKGMTKSETMHEKNMKSVSINIEEDNQIVGLIFTQMQQGAFFVGLESKRLTQLGDFQPICQINPLVSPNLGMSFQCPYLLTISKESNVNIYEVSFTQGQESSLRINLSPKLQIQAHVLIREGIDMRDNLISIRTFDQFPSVFWMEFYIWDENGSRSSIRFLKIEVLKEGFKWQSLNRYIGNLIDLLPRYQHLKNQKTMTEEQIMGIYEDVCYNFGKQWMFDEVFNLNFKV